MRARRASGTASGPPAPRCGAQSAAGQDRRHPCAPAALLACCWLVPVAVHPRRRRRASSCGIVWPLRLPRGSSPLPPPLLAWRRPPRAPPARCGSRARCWFWRRPQAVALIGEFNNWEPKTEHWALKNDFGVWNLFLPDAPDGTPAIKHRCVGVAVCKAAAHVHVCVCGGVWQELTGGPASKCKRVGCGAGLGRGEGPPRGQACPAGCDCVWLQPQACWLLPRHHHQPLPPPPLSPAPTPPARPTHLPLPTAPRSRRGWRLGMASGWSASPPGSSGPRRWVQEKGAGLGRAGLGKRAARQRQSAGQPPLPPAEARG